MAVLDWKYPDLHADHLDWLPCQVGVDLPADVQMIGLCVVAERTTQKGKFVVAVKDGFYWLARQVPAERFDGRRMVEIAKTAIPYGGDDDRIIDPQ